MSRRRTANLKRRPENLRFQRIVNQPNRPQLKFGAKERDIHASDFVAILLRFWRAIFQVCAFTLDTNRIDNLKSSHSEKLYF